MRDNPFLNTSLLLVERGAMAVTFGDWLKAQRKSRKLTQEVVAERIGGGFSYVAVGDWERGKRNPRPENIIAVADALAGPDAADEDRDAMRREARLAAAGVLEENLPEIEREPDEEFIFDSLHAYKGSDPRVVSLKQLAELLREGKAVTPDTPEDELHSQG